MKKLKYCGLIAITAFGLASCGVSKDDMTKECVKAANKAIPEAGFDISNEKNEFYSRTDEVKNKTQAAFGFAFLPENVEYYVVIRGKNPIIDKFWGGTKQAKYECAFDKNGKLITLK
ncbi:hypothetical protein IBE10_03610 [Francisella tularensis subsp. novicida]|uniref:hypothetical protein n=1 Tax=Francisella tularensis TaxID=263 RepID=UPI0008FD8513|nr:hypothetical protein [Francisella tularensis]APC95351.1 hypothetical protein KX02_1555 [Francisella tularensis subsp. novicida]MBK2346016.1 hypothetical protein [Francisella tularensis subsp. novicida]